MNATHSKILTDMIVSMKRIASNPLTTQTVCDHTLGVIDGLQQAMNTADVTMIDVLISTHVRLLTSPLISASVRSHYAGVIDGLQQARIEVSR